jgi:hypothetical protein
VAPMSIGAEIFIGVLLGLFVVVLAVLYAAARQVDDEGRRR